MLATNAMVARTNETMMNRCFFTMPDGKIGIGPCRSQVGDAVFVVPGASFCLVLRPRGGTYELIGDAYVHGVMHSEAIRALGHGEMTKLGERITVS